MSGVTGNQSIIGRDNFDSIVKAYIEILKDFPGFVSAKPTGSYVSNLKKITFGDIDLIVHIDDQRDKKEIKADLANFLINYDEIIPFVSKKYSGKMFYNSGEIITISFQKNLPAAQIDAIIAQTKEEQDFKLKFLNLPAEKQGLILGLIKTVIIEQPESYQIVIDSLSKDQELEFNLSSSELQLRKVNYVPDSEYKQKFREIIWCSNSWYDVVFLLRDYDLDDSFNGLLKQITKKLTNPRSPKRLKGIFNSMISIKSGEQGTKKGLNKQKAINKVNSTFVDESVGIFSGRFQPLTKAHQNIINQISKENDKGIIFLIKGKVTSKDKELNPLGEEVQKRLLRAILPKNMKIKVLATGFFPDELNIMPNTDFTIYTGADRVQTYASFADYMEDGRKLHVKKIARNKMDISATNVRKAVREGNQKRFEELTPIEIHSYYDEIKEKLKEEI